MNKGFYKRKIFLLSFFLITICNYNLSSQKIINLTMEEKPTGEISAGAGIGTDLDL